MTGWRAAVKAAADTAGRIALMVAPERSAAIRTGTCSSDRPRFFALPPRLRALRSGRSAAGLPSLARFQTRSPFRLSRTKVSSASTMPRSFPVAGFNRFKEAMAPAEGGAHRHAAAFGRYLHRIALGQAGAKGQP